MLDRGFTSQELRDKKAENFNEVRTSAEAIGVFITHSGDREVS